MIWKCRTTARTLACLLAFSVPAAPAALADQPVDVTGRERIVDGLIPVTGAERDAVRLDLRIGFELNSARLTDAGRRQLRELAEALTAPRLAEIRIGLRGHTDASGPADYNLRLSERRANAARRYLIERHAIDPARLEAEGFGERRLRPDLAPTAAGQRRVEVVNLTPGRVRPARTEPTAGDGGGGAVSGGGGDDGVSAITD
jgi:outer membrane protein OmpA-like peptidoglycan-associated protein